MKTLFVSIAIIASFAFSILQSTQQEIKIKDCRQTGETDTLTTAHKDRDIVVNRVLKGVTNKNSYNINVYRTDKNHLYHHITYIVYDANYDVAKYKWLNDSIISVNVINSVTSKSQTMKMLCKGKLTGALR